MTSSIISDADDHAIEGASARALRPIGARTQPRVDRLHAPRWQGRYQRALVAADVVMAMVGAIAASLLRWQSDVPPIMGLPSYGITLMVAALWLGLLYLRGAYDRRALGFGLDEFRRVLTSGVYLLAGVAILAYGFEVELSRAFVIGAIFLIVFLTMIGRYSLRRLVHRERKLGRGMHKVLIVGTRESVRDLAVHFSRCPEAGYTVTGACVPLAARATLEVGGISIPVVGRPRNIVDALDRSDADVVAIADTSVLSEGELRDLAWSMSGKEIQLVVAPAIADLAGPRISVNPVAGLPLLEVDEPRFNHGARVLKAVAEAVIAAVALVALSPLLLAIAVLIKTTSRGPVLFRQVRVGLDGRSFQMLKFRTMVENAEALLDQLRDQNEHDGVLFKIQDDPRITPVGRWLRRLSLDELPQLLHVVIGTMALVGPRPPLPREVEQYDDVVRRRLLVRPGLTGLWQVSGRSDLSWEESVRLDVHYVDNWSLGLDVVIVLKTLTAVLRGSGAY